MLIQVKVAFDFLHLFLQHFKAFAAPVTKMTGGSLASAASLASLVRPLPGTNSVLLPTSPGDVEVMSSSNRRRFGRTVVRSLCWGLRRRRRSEGGVWVVELAPPSSFSCRLGVCG